MSGALALFALTPTPPLEMTKEIRDYLTKQLFIERNIVTFRSLSRQFKIHVNQAKNELRTFHATPEPGSGSVHATYLLSGELSSKHTNGDEMDIDDEMLPRENDGEQVPQVTVTLVGEQNLESVKSTYARIFSEHVHCLSPSPVIDAGLICAPSDKVHETDSKLKQDEAATLGRIIGPHVQKGKPVPYIALAQPKEPFARKPTGPGLKATKSKDEVSPTDKPKEQDKAVAPAKTKQSGMLDWSKAKSKQPAKVEETPKVEEKKPKVEDEPKVKAKAKTEAPPKSTKKEEKTQVEEKQKAISKPIKVAEPKRGVKRKSALKIDTDSEEESKPSSREKTPPKQTRPGAKLKRMVVLSDEDEDDEPILPPPKAKAKRGLKAKATLLDFDDDEIPSKEEMSVRAMMDIDDDEVIRVSHSRATSVPTSPETGLESQPDFEPPEPEPKADVSDGDVEMVDSDLDVKPKQVRKRKEKKVVPVGKNGLRKRRVMKSKRVREGEFLVSVDYSEYESVDEEEAEEDAIAKKPAAKGKKTSPKDKEPKEPRKTIRAGQPLKRSGSSAGQKGGQGSLMTFFGKK